ncbi:hypothetical protein OJ996_15265 [Luteolibacter sp. GHJ8]|uniref:Vitamin uptake-like sensor domain-containing protein n=1 Tax=Luteolibacter rhizosphaerae TaxID=2989719 RepID=A0ABT3G535_9BACT|nr:hypothetical protein [Luteolibacter rhizosphaerae]MCW1914947.1 hypothetical protein [Luteolibacter rhizosphaerae]
MTNELLILITEAIAVYFLVLWAHSLRTKLGLAHFYALIGSLTAVMVWVTDAGVKVEIPGVSFMVGSTVFYTALLLGVFVVYVFDGPRATRIAISTIIGVSIMVPVITMVLHWQLKLSSPDTTNYFPPQSLRIYSASIFAAFADLIFLAIAWEFLGKPQLNVRLWLRSFLTLLGVLWLDVVLFATGAFAGTPDYLHIMAGTFTSRLVIGVFAFPFLYWYLAWQNGKNGMEIENRPVLAILKEVTKVRLELSIAQREIERRKEVERENMKLIGSLHQALAEVKSLRGILPTCSYCKNIRDKDGSWHQLEAYIQRHSEAKFSHGVCDVCMAKHHPEIGN